MTLRDTTHLTEPLCSCERPYGKIALEITVAVKYVVSLQDCDHCKIVSRV